MAKHSSISSKGGGSIASPESSGYNPFSMWQCPHCLRSYHCAPSTQTETKIGQDDDEKAALVFLRGTCHHDVCFECIARRSNLVMKKNAANENENLSVTVPCPIVMDHQTRRGGRSCSGNFRVQGANYKYCCSLLHLHASNDDMVIDLSDDEQGEEWKSAISAAAVAAEQPHNGVQGVVKIKREAKRTADDDDDDEFYDLSDC